MIRTHSRVALYARFSSDNQRTESIDAQLRAMKSYCKERNFVIVEVYVDEAKSATTDRRPAFQKMISDSYNKIFDMVLVHKLDRFARNRYDSAVYKRELKKNGVIVCSVLENLDNSPESIMMESVLEGMSEYYSQNLAREVMKGMRETALQCRHTGGKPPLGYDVDELTKKLIINENEAETVKIIFDMYSKGYGYSAILEELNYQNRRTKKGQSFVKNSLYSILTNPKYKGVFVFNRSSAKDCSGKRNTHLYKENEDIIAIEGGCPQIVDSNTFDKVQELISQNKKAGGRMNAKENYLLSGKVFCKECGRSMTGNKRKCGRTKRIYITYKCPSKSYCCSNKEINKGYLENYVVSILEENLLNSSSLHTAAKRVLGHTENIDHIDNSFELKQELEETTQAIKNVTDAIASGLISESLIQKLNELEDRKSHLEREINISSNALKEVSIDVNLILSEYREVKNSPTLPEYKTFIAGFIDRIVVGKYNVDITIKTGLDIFPELNTTHTVSRQEIYNQK